MFLLKYSYTFPALRDHLVLVFCGLHGRVQFQTSSFQCTVVVYSNLVRQFDSKFVLEKVLMALEERQNNLNEREKIFLSKDIFITLQVIP